MPHPRWLTMPLLGFTPKRPTVACVLSGGGSRASFQLGALGYLYRNVPEFSPTILVGASAGSILAAGLAQDGSREAQHRFTTRMTEIWLALREPKEMFTPRPWLERAQTEAPGWLGLMNPKTLPPNPTTRALPKLQFLRTSSPSHPETPPATHLGPLELALQPDEEIPQSEWSLNTLAQLFSNVGKLPRIGSDLMSIHHGMEQTKSMYRPGPVMLQLLDPDVFDPARVRTAGTTLRIAMVALESGELRFMREDGALVDRSDVLFDAGPHPLATGVLASCSIPAVFRPVPLGAETYVDGGVRENLPAQLAIEHLNADRTWIVSSMGVGVAARQSMRDADLFSIIMRTTEILIDEAGRDELEYSDRSDATVIQPELNVHDAMTVDPGLISINMDYGWLRAAEAVLELGDDDVARHRRVIALRMRCWRLEERILSDPQDTPSSESLERAKTEMREAVNTCDARALPDGAGNWWSSFERHVGTVDIPPPWLQEADDAP